MEIGYEKSESTFSRFFIIQRIKRWKFRVRELRK